ncbi:MAG TPA: hypothetical protein VHB50_09970 [Bryobacteraceae bacterium]|nr:hypothetical protein [Bryobacteraceae bacterium]
MSKPFGIGFGVALAVILVIVWIAYARTKGNHLEPMGKIGKVRTQQVDENEMFVILDFSLQNDSDRQMVVRSVESSLEMPDGSSVDGHVVAAKDLDNVFKNYPMLGEQYNPPLRARDVLRGHERIDRMVGVRFDVPESEFGKRKDLALRIEDITGPVAELKTR